MKYRTRIYYTDSQKAEMWDRWERGESLNAIGRVFDRNSSSIFGVLSPTGGIRPWKENVPNSRCLYKNVKRSHEGLCVIYLFAR